MTATFGAPSQHIADAQQGSRNLEFDLAVVPKGKVAVLERIELYLAMPLSLVLNNWNEIERDLSEGGQSARIAAKPAFGFGFAGVVGARFLVTDSLGVFAELGYGYRRFAHTINTTFAQAGTSVDGELARTVSFHQFVWDFGAFF